MLADISLNDKYTRESGRIFVTGIQALVRLPLLQSSLDAASGLNTAGYITGYRGSPLGGFDLQLWQAKDFLEPRNIIFNRESTKTLLQLRSGEHSRLKSMVKVSLMGFSPFGMEKVPEWTGQAMHSDTQI